MVELKKWTIEGTFGGETKVPIKELKTIRFEGYKPAKAEFCMNLTTGFIEFKGLEPLRKDE